MMAGELIIEKTVEKSKINMIYFKQKSQQVLNIIHTYD